MKYVGVKVMIADDAAFMRAVIRRIVESTGCSVVAEARDGQEAVECFEKYKPDVVFMDITMSKIDGITAVKLIMDKHKQARIIMCSAMGQQWMIEDAIKYGAKFFILKPFKENNIKEALEYVCRNDLVNSAV